MISKKEAKELNKKFIYEMKTLQQPLLNAAASGIISVKRLESSFADAIFGDNEIQKAAKLVLYALFHRRHL